MKKSIIILLSIIFLLTACTKNSAKNSLNQLPKNYDLNDAKNDNCVIFENSDITYGQTVWDDFISATKRLVCYCRGWYFIIRLITFHITQTGIIRK